jgi:NADPH:quinone reductase-like Zn-dependent oxidoreductase
LKVGDRVIGFCDYKAWSEVVAIPAQFVYKMPENMSFQDGAALPMSYLTAYILLFDIANLRQGQSVFTHSVGGGVVCVLAIKVYYLVKHYMISKGKNLNN